MCIIGTMRSVHDAAYRASLQSRIKALTTQSARRWGKMAPDQMLWHINFGMTVALGEATITPKKAPLPRPVLKFIVLNMPWPKGAPTAPEFLAGDRYDFEAERARALQLI